MEFSAETKIHNNNLFVIIFFCYSKETGNEEFEIAVNGPNLAHADAVILEAVDLYWGGKDWHFHRTGQIDKLINPTVIKYPIKYQILNT